MARKVFDDEAGKHVAKQTSLAVDDIYEPLAQVLAVECPRCNAKPGDVCTTIVGKQGERVYPHPARIDLARSKA